MLRPMGLRLGGADWVPRTDRRVKVGIKRGFPRGRESPGQSRLRVRVLIAVPSLQSCHACYTRCGFLQPRISGKLCRRGTGSFQSNGSLNCIEHRPQQELADYHSLNRQTAPSHLRGGSRRDALRSLSHHTNFAGRDRISSKVKPVFESGAKNALALVWRTHLKCSPVRRRHASSTSVHSSFTAAMSPNRPGPR